MKSQGCSLLSAAVRAAAALKAPESASHSAWLPLYVCVDRGRGLHCDELQRQIPPQTARRSDQLMTSVTTEFRSAHPNTLTWVYCGGLALWFGGANITSQK